MQRALMLAARGRGRTSPNPMVGATVVAGDGVILGDGWHQQAGTPHAEIHALAKAEYPAPTKAIYFVADGTGGHVFAETFAEHQAKVQKWYAIRRARGEM